MFAGPLVRSCRRHALAAVAAPARWARTLHAASAPSAAATGHGASAASPPPAAPEAAGPTAAAAAAAASQVPRIFDRAAKRRQRDRAALAPDSRQVDYLKDEIADRLMDRFLDIKRRFHTVLDLGSGCGHIIKFAEPELVKKLVMMDMSPQMLARDKDIQYPVETERVVGDEEHLPFAEETFDAVVSNLSLHWVNDLTGSLIQVRRSLKSDGAFIGAMFGGDTLFELRTAMQLAEMERTGGVAPHVSPMTDTRDVGNLLSRAGFNLTTVDIDEIVVNYPSMFELMEDLRTMGENNAIATRKHSVSKDTFMAAAATYKAIYGNEDGSIPATFQVIYMIGWKPDPSQPKPLKRGSGEISLKKLEENNGNFAAPPLPSDGAKKSCE
ncbi:S-adenosyl-L-methionine-dependent methyltransferase [Entophlyctis helioformis]|nr:S-adenosyl-L-methionine-dependent methyltransferase [Entophlyctis helioformis]